MSRVLEYAKKVPWAITEDALETIFAIASREFDNPEAIEKALGAKHEDTEKARVRDGVAIVPVHGPLFRYANLFTRISGATSTEMLANDIGALLDDHMVRAIVLDIDSPGGMVNGTSELAELIFQGREQKPIYSYISGLGASAAYHIASAGTEVFANSLALVGSIGAVLEVVDYRKTDEKHGVRSIEFVSAQSPKKRMDPFDDDPDAAAEGKSALQKLVDDLAGVFVADVARFRGVAVDTVLSDFGQGAVLVGQEAFDAGLVDGVTTLEALLAHISQNQRQVGDAGFRLAAELRPTPIANPDSKDVDMSDTKTEPAAEKQPDIITQADFDARVAEARLEGATAERERILAIAKLHGPEDLKAECIADAGVTQGDAAVRINAAQRAGDEARAKLHIDERAEAEDDIDAPEPSADIEATDDIKKTVARAVALHNSLKGDSPVARA